MTAAVDPFDIIGKRVGVKPAPPITDRAPVTYLATAGTAYAQRALDAECERVSGAQPGERNHTLNRAAFSLGQLVAGGALAKDEVVHGLTLAAEQVGLERREIERTIDSGLRGGEEAPRGVPEQPDAEAWLASIGVSQPVPVMDVDETTGEMVERPPTDAERAEFLHRRAVERAVAELRLKDEATRLFRAEQAAATFREPPSVWTLADELAIPDEPVTYAIDDLLPTGANALLAAQFKTGKTTLINNYARAFADGEPFLGRYDVNPAGGRLAIYNYEVGRDQYRRWLRDMNIANPDRIVILNLRGFRLPLSVPSVEDWVVQWLREREVTAWVVDPFARASVGTDENSNTEVGVWLDTLDVIKERAGVRDLVLPTHTGRAEQDAGQERARGATRLDDWADVRWLLTKDDEDNRYFRATGRDVDVAEELLTFDEADRRLSIGGGDRRWVRKRAVEDRVVSYVAAHPGQSGAEVYRGLGGKKDDVYAALKDGVRARRLRIEAGPKNADLYHVTLTEEPS